MNLFYLIEKSINFIKEKHPNRTDTYDKCYRDLSYIVEALEKDILYNTNMFTIRVANRFWYNNVRQISAYDAEIAVYNFMLENLDLSNEKYTIAEKSINLLIDIVINGPMLISKENVILQQSLSAEHCQRNWDYTKSISEEDIDFLTKIATTMPTKQNIEYYSLLVSTNITLNNEIFKWSINLKNKRTIKRNTQIKAPLLFLYSVNKNIKFENVVETSPSITDVCLAVGVSSGALALAASQLNYKTGFCACFESTEISKVLLSYNLSHYSDIVLAVGVGHPNNQYLYNYNTEQERHLTRYQKTIKTTRI